MAPPDGRQVCENGSKELLSGASSTDPACHRAEVTPFGLSGVVWGLRAHRKHFAPQSGKKKSSIFFFLRLECMCFWFAGR